MAIHPAAWLLIPATIAIIIYFGISISTKDKQGFENLSESQTAGLSIGAILAVIAIIVVIYAGLQYQTGQILRKYGL